MMKSLSEKAGLSLYMTLCFFGGDRFFRVCVAIVQFFG